MAELPFWSLHDIEELDELVGRVQLLTDRYKNALIATLNRAAMGGRADALKMVREGYNLLPADLARVRRRFHIRKARFTSPVAYLYALDRHGRHISERQPYAAWEGVKYSCLHGRALVSGPRVFIGRGQYSEKVIVFRRLSGKVESRAKHPWKKLGGMIQERKVEAQYTESELTFLQGSGREELLARVRARLVKEARSQLDYQIRRIFDKKWGVRPEKKP